MIKPGQGYYVELTPSGAVKPEILEKESGVSKDAFKPTGEQLTPQQKSNIEAGKPTSYKLSGSGRSSRSKTESRTESKPVEFREAPISKTTEEKAPQVSNAIADSGETIKTKETSFKSQVYASIIREAEQNPNVTITREPVTPKDDASKTEKVYSERETNFLDRAREKLLMNQAKTEPGFKDLPERYTIFTASAGLGAVQSGVDTVKLGYSLFTQPGETIKGAGRGVLEVVRNPGETFSSIKQSVKREPGRVAGRVVGDIFIGEGLFSASKTAVSGARSFFIPVQDIRVKPTGAKWELKTSAVALTEKEAYIQKPGIQTTINGGAVTDRNIYILSEAEQIATRSAVQNDIQTTLKGNLISDQATRNVLEAKGLQSGKQSPLRLPNEYYQGISEAPTESYKLNLLLVPQNEIKKGTIQYINKFNDELATPTIYNTEPVLYRTSLKQNVEPSLAVTTSRSGKNILLDESIGYVGTEATEIGGYALTTFGKVGTQTRSFQETTIRVIDKTTGKAYKVPPEYLERRLIKNPNLKVDESFKLYADPSGGLITTGQRLFDYSFKPSVKVESATPIIRPRITSEPTTTTTLRPPAYFPSSTKQESATFTIYASAQEKRTETISITNLKTKSATESKLQPTTAIIQETETRPRSILLSGTGQRIITKSLSAVKSETAVESISKVETETKLKPFISFNIRARAKTINKPFEQTTPKLRYNIQQNDDEGGAFSVQVRRGGLFREVGVFSTPEEAFRKGKDIVSGGAGVSFKILSGGESLKPNMFNLGERFTTGKKEPEVFIQKSKFRISSSGEREEITQKGLFTIQAKRKGAGFGFF